MTDNIERLEKVVDEQAKQLNNLAETVIRSTAVTEEFVREQREINKHFKNEHRKTDEFINGKPGHHGAKVLIDRLVQRNRILTWLGSTVIGAYIVTAARYLWPGGGS